MRHNYRTKSYLEDNIIIIKQKEKREIKVEEEGFVFCGHKHDVGLVKESCSMQPTFCDDYGFLLEVM